MMHLKSRFAAGALLLGIALMAACGGGGGGGGGSNTTTQVSMTGTWTGTWVTTAPSACAGIDGTWQATVVQDTGGHLTGTYTSSAGYSGDIDGNRNGGAFNWTVGGGGQGVAFTGALDGTHASGDWQDGPNCFGRGKTSGTFEGAKE